MKHHRINAKEIIREYDFSFVYEKTTRFHNDIDKFHHACSELRKFFTLLIKTDEATAIPSQDVDDVWHAFILFTPQYRDFCDQVLGEYIDHQPNTKLTPVPLEAVSNFYKTYHDEYHNLDRLWLSDFPPPTHNSLRNGVVPSGFANNFKWSGWPGRKKDN